MGISSFRNKMYGDKPVGTKIFSPLLTKVSLSPLREVPLYNNYVLPY